jgi:hypothetical protein
MLKTAPVQEVTCALGDNYGGLLAQQLQGRQIQVIKMEVGNQDSIDVPILARPPGDVAMVEMGDPGPQNRVGEQTDAVHLNQYRSMTNISKMGSIIH